MRRAMRRRSFLAGALAGLLAALGWRAPAGARPANVRYFRVTRPKGKG